MNPDKNEEANQINLGRKCRDDLFNGLGLDEQVWILFTRKQFTTSLLVFSKGRR